MRGQVSKQFNALQNNIYSPQMRGKRITPWKTIQRQSRQGDPVTLDLYKDIDDGIKGAWIVHLIELSTEQQPGGYLKIAYIPKAKQEALYPDPLHWAANHLNRYGNLNNLLNKPEQHWSKDELLAVLSDTDPWHVSLTAKKERAKCSMGDLREAWQKRSALLKEEHHAHWQRFCQFHVDYPVVDFARIYQQDESNLYQGGERHESLTSPDDMRGRGLATLMYETAALWMDSQGLRLYASDTQSGDAEKVWSSFTDKGLVTTNDSRQYLDVTKLLAQKPELAWG